MPQRVSIINDIDGRKRMTYRGDTQLWWNATTIRIGGNVAKTVASARRLNQVSDSHGLGIHAYVKDGVFHIDTRAGTHKVYQAMAIHRPTGMRMIEVIDHSTAGNRALTPSNYTAFTMSDANRAMLQHAFGTSWTPPKRLERRTIDDLGDCLVDEENCTLYILQPSF